MEILSRNETWIIIAFVLGYILITLEHVIKINKATIALAMGVICWVIEFSGKAQCDGNLACLGSHLQENLANISQIIFFLLGAMTIVETINAHKGFGVISNLINFSSKRKLLWVVSFIAFGLSAILDNLTTTIVIITLLKDLIDKGEDRLLIGGAAVIAANAGGAWTPIGDVTTTMLWIGGQVTTVEIMRSLFIPSIVCLIVSLLFFSIFIKGEFATKNIHFTENKIEPMGRIIFFLGVGVLIFVPIFKLLTGLPPFMGMLFGLSVLWLVTDLVHSKYEERSHLRVPQVLTRVDLPGVLFFLGILLAIDALDAAKILENLAVGLDNSVGSLPLIAIFIGLASAVVDNVPLVAATMGMYSLEQYPPDHKLWQMIAFCAGTGGSILIIGSAAGVIFMGMEKVDFFWYVRRISLPALAGYLAGIGWYLFFQT